MFDEESLSDKSRSFETPQLLLNIVFSKNLSSLDNNITP